MKIINLIQSIKNKLKLLGSKDLNYEKENGNSQSVFGSEVSVSPSISNTTDSNTTEYTNNDMTFIEKIKKNIEVVREIVDKFHEVFTEEKITKAKNCIETLVAIFTGVKTLVTTIKECAEEYKKANLSDLEEETVETETDKSE